MSTRTRPKSSLQSVVGVETPASTSPGTITVWGNADGTSVVDTPVVVTPGSGNISTPGTVNGRDVTADGIALDSAIVDITNLDIDLTALEGTVSSHLIDTTNPHSTGISNLTDVSITGISTNDVLLWSGTEWVNGTVAGTAPVTLTAGAGLTGGGDTTTDRTFNVAANPDGSIIVNPNDIQVGILASDTQHGNRGGGSQHSVATTLANGFMSSADKTKLDAYPASPADSSLTLTAGTGMTGGGTLTGPITFNVGANADGSITVNANDIQVGVLASDTQHGTRGGGTQHSIATTSVAGFMSSSDKTKLDAIPASIVSTTTTITAGAGMTGGGDLSANRTLDIVANVDGSIVVNANDIQIGVLASDTQHGTRGGGTQHSVATTSVAGFMSSADKTKLDGVETGANATVLATTVSPNVSATAATVGVSTEAARKDHTHQVSTGSPVSVGTTNSAGTATTLSLSDHVHAHGSQTDGSLHAIVTSSVNGFMSSTDKNYLDAQLAPGEPSGFPNHTDSVISRNDLTRTFTIQPASVSFDYYYDSIKRNVSAAETIVWSNTDGIHFIYYDGPTLTTSMTAWDLTDTTLVPIAAVVWNVAQQSSFILEERHGFTMDSATHLYLHSTRGTQLVSGGFVTAGSYTVGGTTDAENSFGIGTTVIADEDIRTTVSALTDGSAITRMWRTGANGIWAWDTSAVFPKVGTTTYIAFNEWTGTTWQLTSIASAEYVNWWLFVVPAIDAINQYVLIPGQNKFTSLVDASAEGVDSINWGNVPFTESAVLARVTYRADTGLTTTGKCTIEQIVSIRGTSLVVNNGSVGIVDLGIDTRTSTTLDVTSSNGLDATVPAATTLLAGLMTASDKTKLDGIASGATATPLSSSGLPSDLGTASAGTATEAARKDHVHAHGNLSDGAMHAVATTSVAGFMSAADKTKLDGFPASSVSTSRTLTAGAGLTGGGDLTADRTFNVAANADGSIVVNADNIQVGILATDAQHGNRGGGTLHSVATTSVAGFMSGSDKTKLDAITGTNTGDQTITLTGDVTGSGTGSFAATIAADAVTFAKMQNVATGSILGRTTAGTGDIETIASTTLGRTLLTIADQPTAANTVLPTQATHNGKYLTTDGTNVSWATVAGGGGSGDVVGPASSTDNAVVRFDGTTGKLVQDSSVILGDDNSLNGVQFAGLNDYATNSLPAAPASGARLFNKFKTGRRMIGQVGPSGVDYLFQPSLFGNTWRYWGAIGAGTGTSVMNFVATATGTATTRAPATTRFFTSLRRLGYVSAATANSAAGIRQALATVVRGNATNVGGFFFVAKFGIAAVATNWRLFVGLQAGTGAPSSVDPSTFVNAIGMSADSADTEYQFICNNASGTATKTAMGASFPKDTVVSTNMYDFRMFCAPNDSAVYWSVENLTTGAFTEGSNSSVKLPVNTTYLAPHIWINNGGTAAAVGIDIQHLYIETDY